MKTFLSMLLICFALGSYFLYQNSNNQENELFASKNGYAWAGQTDGNLIDMLKENDYLVVQLGAGGEVIGMLDTIEFLKDHPEKSVIIDGRCYSACTLLLAAPNMYFTDRAEFFFHSAATYSCTDDKVKISINKTFNTVMLRNFSSEIQGWIVKNKAFATLGFTKMPDDYLYEYREHIVNSSNFPTYEFPDGGESLKNGDACDAETFK